MNELCYKIDDTVIIDGETYTLDMSFDNILLLLKLVNNPKVKDVEKITYGLKLLLDESTFVETYPLETKQHIFQELIDAIFQKEETKLPVDVDGNVIPINLKKEKPIYDFAHDAKYIYASFMQAYGIDLFAEQGKLHWIKFQALLSGLPEDTKFSQVVQIRMKKEHKDMSSEEKRRLRELKDYYALPE